MCASALYDNSLEHLLDELRIINIFLTRWFSELNKNNQESENLFHGLAISDDRIIKILTKLSKSHRTDTVWPLSEQDEIKSVSQQIRKKKLSSLNNNVMLSLPLLAERFSLTPFEEKVLLVCLAPEIDSSYETLYAYFQDNISKKRPTPNFILDLLCTSTEEKMLCKRYMSEHGKLRRYGLIRAVEADQGASESLVLESRVLGFLLDSKFIDYPLKYVCEFILPDKRPILSGNQESILQKIISQIGSTKSQKNDSGSRFCLLGSKGVGKKALVQAVCHDLKRSLLCVNVAEATSSENLGDLYTKLLREAVLCNSAVYLENFDSIIYDPTKKTKFLNLIDSLENNVELLFFGICSDPIPDILQKKDIFVIHLSPLTHHERKNMWKSYLQDKVSDAQIIELANRFNLNAQQIESAYFTAKNLSSLTKHGDTEFPIVHLYDACRQQYHGKLSHLTLKILSGYSWDDLVLPPSKKTQIQEAIEYVRNKNKVFSEWGFEQKLITNKGVNILFYGQSGTGKTMTASIFAKEIGFDLYKINLANILNKYVGETEKNLEKIFDEVKSSNSILFFDEADALFGKRTELKDSHDRYANIEVSYLLQKLEEHDEVIILATNLAKNMDEAFLRRMHFVIEFPFPNKTQRQKIWRNAFPSTCPLSVTEDEFDFLATNFDLSGGNIKNIVISAAFLASSSSSAIDMHHIVLAIKKEYEKIGRPCNRAEFGDYFPLIQNTIIT